MRFNDLVSMSVKSLLRNQARSFLTMLGIVIGIASVILMISTGRAAESFILSQVASFGPDVLIAMNGSLEGATRAPPPLTKQTLSWKDVRALKREPWVQNLSANVLSVSTISYDAENMNANVYGATEDEIKIFPSDVRLGRFLLEEDVDGRGRVAVLGDKISRELFGDASPLGKQIKIRRLNFRVIGVMDKSGTRFFTNLDEIVYIPVTTAMDVYNRDRLTFISFTPTGFSVDRAQTAALLLLRETHKLDNPAGDLSKDDFHVGTQADARQNASTISMILTILLGSIAAISLIVGGVGIMNIMYVTVSERIAEIGLRKAIGARHIDILGQFLAEAVVLTVLGGIVGIILGFFLSWIAIQILNQFQSGWSLTISPSSMALAFGVSAAIGIVFGYYPARRASRLSPMEALRYE